MAIVSPVGMFAEETTGEDVLAPIEEPLLFSAGVPVSTGGSWPVPFSAGVFAIRPKYQKAKTPSIRTMTIIKIIFFTVIEIDAQELYCDHLDMSRICGP